MYLTEEELLAQLRRQGSECIEDVKAVYIEGGSQLTIIPRKSGTQLLQ